MKKILALVLCVVMVMSFASMASAATETITYDFKDLAVSSDGEMTAEKALAAFQAATTDTQLVSVEVSKVYAGNNSTGGCHKNENGYLKLGTSSVNGTIKMTYPEGVKVTKVEIYCHDWYTLSDSHPTNSNKISVNGSEAVLLPYNANGDVEVRSFDITATNEVNIETNFRGFISKIVVYTEVADAPGEDTPPTGDMIAVALATLAISGAGIAVLAKKKEY